MGMGFSVGQMGKLMKGPGKITCNMVKGISPRKEVYLSILNMKMEKE